jgi:hypothetical protein
MAGLRGSCQCGGVQFEVPETFEARTFCHCTTCKKLSGGVGTVKERAADGSELARLVSVT